MNKPKQDNRGKSEEADDVVKKNQKNNNKNRIQRTHGANKIKTDIQRQTMLFQKYAPPKENSSLKEILDTKCVIDQNICTYFGGLP